MRIRFITVLTVLAFAACTTERAAAPVAEAEGYATFQQRDRAYLAARSSTPAVDEVAIAERAFRSPPLPAATNMIIRTATASIQVDSLEPAVALVTQLAERVGGYVAGSGIATGKDRLRQAFIEVKIPAQRFDDVVAGLTPIGKLESVNVNSQDVGEEFVDVTARMDNARRLERRLIDLLATRTGKLKDVLDVERELARVREEIDRYEGRIRYLQAHTAMSTLSVTVHEPLPVVGEAGHSIMGEAFTQAWRNFVVLMSLAVQSLGVILPLGLVAGGAWLVTRRWRLGRQRTA